MHQRPNQSGKPHMYHQQAKGPEFHGPRSGMVPAESREETSGPQNQPWKYSEAGAPIESCPENLSGRGLEYLLCKARTFSRMHRPSFSMR